MADSLAGRLKREAGEDRAKQINLAYELAYQRKAKDDERQSALEYVKDFGMNELCLLLLNSDEFVYVD